MAPKRSESSQSGKMKEPLMKLSERFPGVATKELTKALTDAKNDVNAAEEALKQAGHKPGSKAPSKKSSSPTGSKKSPAGSRASSPSKKASKASKADSPAPSSKRSSHASPPPPPEPTPTPVEETEEEKEQKQAIKKLVLETSRSVEECGDALRLANWDLKKAEAMLTLGDRMDREDAVIRLRRFFAKYKPSAASTEESYKFLKRWQGAEDQMWKILVETYGEPPDNAEADVLLANLTSVASHRSGFPEALQGHTPSSASPSRHGSLPHVSSGLPPPPVRQSVPSSFPSQPQYQQYDPPQQHRSNNLHSHGAGPAGAPPASGHEQGGYMYSGSPFPSHDPGVPDVVRHDSTLQPPIYSQHASYAQPRMPSMSGGGVPGFPGMPGMQGMPGGGVPGFPGMPGMTGAPGEMPPWMQAPWLLPGMYPQQARMSMSTSESESTVYEEEPEPRKPSVQVQKRSSQSPNKKAPSAFARPIPDRSAEMERMILDKIKGIEDVLLAVATPKTPRDDRAKGATPSPVPVADLPPPPPPPPPLPETPPLRALPTPAKQVLQETQAIQARTRAAAELARKLRRENASQQPASPSTFTGPPIAHRTEPRGPVKHGLPEEDVDMAVPFSPPSALGGALSSIVGFNPSTSMTDNYQLLLTKQQELLSRSQDQGDKVKIRALEKELGQMQHRFADAQRHQAEQLEVISAIQKQIETDSLLTRGSISHLEDLTEGVQGWAARLYQQQQDYLDMKAMNLKKEALEHQQRMANMHLHKPEDIAMLAQKQEEIMQKTKTLADQRAQLLKDPLRQADVMSEMAEIEGSLRQSQARQRQYEGTLQSLTNMMANGMLSLNSVQRQESPQPPPPPPGPPPPQAAYAHYQPAPAEPSPPPPPPVPPPPPPQPPQPQPTPLPQYHAPELSHPPPGSYYQHYRQRSPSEATTPVEKEVMHELGTVKEVLKLLVKHQVEQSSQQEEQQMAMARRELNDLHEARRHSEMLESTILAYKEKERERARAQRPETPTHRTRSGRRRAERESPRPSPRQRSLSKTSSPSRRAAEDALNLTAPKSPRSANIQQSLMSISEAVQQLKSGAYRNSSATPSTPVPTVTTLPASPASHARPQEHRAPPPPENPHRAVLVQFYKKQDPSKLKDVDTILERFQGHDNTLFHSLAKKYNIKCSPYRERLISFYSKYNPSKLCEVDIILHLVEGNEEKFLKYAPKHHHPHHRKLEAKYIRNE